MLSHSASLSRDSSPAHPPHSSQTLPKPACGSKKFGAFLKDLNIFFRFLPSDTARARMPHPKFSMQIFDACNSLHGKGLWNILFRDGDVVTIAQLGKRRILRQALKIAVLLWIAFWFIATLCLFGPADFPDPTQGIPMLLTDLSICGTALLVLLLTAFLATIFFRRRLLAFWLPTLICPKCFQTIKLVEQWECVGGCPSRGVRHVLSPCSDCGTVLEGLHCPSKKCRHLISFSDVYNEFELANHDKPYVTISSRRYRNAVFMFAAVTPLMYVSFRANWNILGWIFLAISLLSVVAMILSPPKTLVMNIHHHFEEQSKCQTAKA